MGDMALWYEGNQILRETYQEISTRLVCPWHNNSHTTIQVAQGTQVYIYSSITLWKDKKTVGSEKAIRKISVSE